ncbi:hypothetical protein [Amycolatopsis sp. WGS_07]|uniref:hypothetical protein n=1 Tax=Amycolatopsis sp. WGS_07 TaxID=3076764 RepID=UPI003872F028
MTKQVIPAAPSPFGNPSRSAFRPGYFLPPGASVVLLQTAIFTETRASLALRHSKGYRVGEPNDAVTETSHIR